jgi:hypothetical protein
MGRKSKEDNTKAERRNITLSQEALIIFDAQKNKSKFVNELILKNNEKK